MNNFDKKVLFFDIDGTLLVTQEHLVVKSTIKILKELHQRDDIDIYISSGRSLNATGDIDIIKPYFTGFNVANGCSIFINGKELFRNSIDSNEVRTLVKEFETKEISYVLVQPLEFYARFFNDDIKKDFSSVMHGPAHIIKNKKDICYDDIIEIWILDTRETIEIFEAKYANLTFFKWGPYGCDVLKKGASKAIGIKKIIELQGYDYNKTYAFGDSDNDLPMFEIVKYSIAMGQANDNAKEKATYVTKPIKEDGLAYAIKEYVLKK